MEFQSESMPSGAPKASSRQSSMLLEMSKQRHLLEQLECEAQLPEVPLDGAAALREYRLRVRHQLEDGPLGALHGVGPHDHRPGAVPEDGLPDQAPHLALVGTVERERGDLGADDEHPGSPVVLGDVLGVAQHRAAGEAGPGGTAWSA